MNVISEKLINFRVYAENSELLGLADVTLPTLEAKSETISGAGIAGEVVFADSDNPITDLANGQATFRIYWTPPPPAESITFLIEYDAAALASLFAA